MLDEIEEPQFLENEAQSFVTTEMQHFGSILGVPSNPEPYRNVMHATADKWHIKHIIARRIITACLSRAKIEVWERIKHRIEKDGVGVLQSILDSDSVLDAVVGV